MKIFLKIIASLVLFIFIVFSQVLHDKYSSKSSQKKPLIPTVQIVKAADLGLHSAASSLYWLYTIQYFGGARKDEYKNLPDYINLVTDLDPKFSHPYAFAPLVMPPYNLTDQAIDIAQKGIENSEPNWEIAYNLGLLYHMHKEDQSQALKYFDLAAQTPNAPDFAKWIATNYGSRPDIREQSKLIWQGVAENTNDQVLKERAETYIYHYELMSFLEKTATIYKEKFGQYPEPIEKLVEANILSEIPKDPFGYVFKIDDDGRVRGVIDK